MPGEQTQPEANRPTPASRPEPPRPDYAPTTPTTTPQPAPSDPTQRFIALARAAFGADDAEATPTAPPAGPPPPPPPTDTPGMTNALDIFLNMIRLNVPPYLDALIRDSNVIDLRPPWDRNQLAGMDLSLGDRLRAGPHPGTIELNGPMGDELAQVLLDALRSPGPRNLGPAWEGPPSDWPTPWDIWWP